MEVNEGSFAPISDRDHSTHFMKDWTQECTELRGELLDCSGTEPLSSSQEPLATTAELPCM